MILRYFLSIFPSSSELSSSSRIHFFIETSFSLLVIIEAILNNIYRDLTKKLQYAFKSTIQTWTAKKKHKSAENCLFLSNAKSTKKFFSALIAQNEKSPKKMKMQHFEDFFVRTRASKGLKPAKNQQDFNVFLPIFFSYPWLWRTFQSFGTPTRNPILCCKTQQLTFEQTAAKYKTCSSSLTFTWWMTELFAKCVKLTIMCRFMWHFSHPSGHFLIHWKSASRHKKKKVSIYWTAFCRAITSMAF